MSNTSATLPAELKSRIDALVASRDVVLFMKGSRSAPRCGFSASVVEILDEVLPGADAYVTVDVLADPTLREGIKVYSDWPTIPQLYVKGEFVGGADIARDLASSGELHRLLGVSPPAASGPLEVTVTAAAAQAIREAHASEPPEHRFLRLAVTPRFQHQLGFSEEKPGDLKVVCEGVELVVDAASAKRAHGVRIDAVPQPGGGVAFRIDNPNQPPSVKQMSVRQLKEQLDAARAGGPAVVLLDVRTPGERATARIDGSRLLDDDGRAYVDALPRETPLVFHCHHGGRSQAAAEHYLKQGFKTVFNVAGGIDAWSIEVDSSVPRY